MSDDDLGKKIQQIAGLLGQDKMPDNVKDLLSVLSGSFSESSDSKDKASGIANTGSEQPDAASRENSNIPVSTDSSDNAELFMRAKKMMDKLGTGNDPRVNLLHAIKPFMSGKRQQKIGH
ncbi:MAG: hypothetical protein Q8924_20060, partial [Bacillota bacterium]|nr:hypothetical protein [Bacillota bacterium]